MAEEGSGGGRGTIGRQTYERVRELLANGDLTTRAAFERVAEETGRSVGTVQTAYYRVARSLPDGGGVKQRPRSGRATSTATARTTGRGPGRPRRESSDVDVLVKDVERAMAALLRRVRELEDGQKELRDYARRYQEIQRIAGRS